MLQVLFWIIVSLFAVLGFLQASLTLLELIALHKVEVVQKATFRVDLAGDDKNVEFLLHTLALMSERLDVGGVEAELELVDVGLSKETAVMVQEYCEKNPWVRFTEREDNGII